jgi:hypothetical protein
MTEICRQKLFNMRALKKSKKDLCPETGLLILKKYDFSKLHFQYLDF